MKTLQAELKSGSKLSPELSNLLAAKPNLVIVFGPAQDFKTGGRVSEVVRGFEPGTMIVGCSTAGEIANSGVADGSLVLSACRFDKVQIKPVSASISSMQDSYRCGKALVEKIEKDGLRALFILGPGLEINGSALINGIRYVVGPNVVITGGLAGDGGAFKKTFTLLQNEVSSNRVVGFAIYGDSLKVAYGSMGGWEPFGPVRRVTRSEANVLYEIDGEPALDLYKKYLGEAAKQLPASGLLYPFAVLNDKDDSTGIIRTILGIDEEKKSLTFAGDIPLNGRVRLMHSSKKGLTSGAQGAAKAALSHVSDAGQNGLALLISCVGRKLVMGSDIEDELDAVREEFGKVTVTGFYSYGEICPEAGFTECKLHNQTMTITYFYE